ncbi:hypothetical protein [Marinobacter sp. JSM 1782161]|uniref:hypothetical protein n=1 Tax=Marinobacter sp. JSM 1782161 TaxID=2685906 RepID=UPI001401EC97|nr:hypothetical protein [Marinobacter sp. JSM 1782161]
MKTNRFWLTAVGFVATSGVSAATFTFTGTAQAPDQSALYEERHTVEGTCEAGQFRPRDHQVDYIALNESLGPRNEVFARKDLEYASDPLRPTVDFTQSQFQERMRIRNVDDRVARIDWQEPSGDRVNEEVPLSDNAVIDAGFVHLIQKHWAALNQGRSVDFEFLAPTRGESYRFVAEPTESDTLDAHLVVSMRPSQMFLRWLVDPILLGFDSEGRIVRYQGLGNIRKNLDENYTIDLRYRYGESPCPLVTGSATGD